MSPGAIVFASEYYPPFAPGGAEWSAAAWAAALARRGRRVVVVTPNYGAAPRESRDGVEVERPAFPLRLRPGQGEVRWLAHRNPLFYWWLARHLARVVRRERAAVIHAQGKAALVAASWAGARTATPVVATVRDAGLLCPLGFCTLFEPWETFDCSARQYRDKCVPYFLAHYHSRASAVRRLVLRASLRLGWLDQRLRHAALARAAAVVGVSRGILRIYPERLVGGGRARVVHTLPPPEAHLAAAPWPASPEAVRDRLGIGPGPLVLCAGKLSLGKGTPVLLQAIPAVRGKVPGARFAFAGKGELAIPAAPDVHVLGSIPHADLLALYRAAAVVVVPSIWPEPLSRVLLEAMRAGVPVVATAVGGTPEAVADGETGVLVPPGDAAALAGALADLLLDPARRARMGAAARRRAERAFAEDDIVAALLQAYDAAAAGEPAGT